jgi:Protein of unknown function (DUF4246)
MASLTLPGFTEPLDFVSHEGRTEYVHAEGDARRVRKAINVPPAGSGREMFSNALCATDCDSSARLQLTTIRELLMLQFMNEVTDKPNWNVKVKDDSLTEKWKGEAMQQANFTERMATYCIEELRWRADKFEKTGFVFVYDGDVVKSDAAVSTELKHRLQVAVEKLENIPTEDKDYHPNSNEQVWDLVHPSLFPLVYGTSRILRDQVIGLDDCMSRCGTGEIVPVPSKPRRQEGSRPLYSTKFQWLPCDVKLSTVSSASTERKCTICSYINNLHPERHQDLYGVIEDIIAVTIPLWNETLLSHESGARLQRIPYTEVWYDPEPEDHPDWPEEDQDYDDAYNEVRLKCLIHPEPEPFQIPKEDGSPVPEELPFVKRFAATGLQVIVKLATIELTPQKPSYGGGAWHVEGQLNEHICATALYYYSSENITESRLAFRQMSAGGSSLDIGHEQNDHAFLQPIFGCRNDDAAVQEAGSILCKEGRLVTFPNTLQHRVLPFELADKSKPGYRKILAIFLVDPNLHIISTASVPPQRRDWWSDKVGANGIGGLSTDLRDKVVNMLDFPLTMERAKKLQLELMAERMSFEEKTSKSFRSVKFSLCEH